MKKIFAIALAVVMVLSMASAFALNACATWAPAWDCTADATLCGKGSVEVVPYVKVNTSCGWEWQVSDCAAAIKTENVYYAIKLTVEENADPDWWEAATLEIETEGLVNGVDVPAAPVSGLDLDEAGVYYLAENLATWFDLEDWADLTATQQDAYIFGAQVADQNVCTSNGYSVCATLASYYDGWSVPKFNKVGDYVYGFSADVEDEFTGTFWIGNADDTTEGVNLFVEEGAILGDSRSSNAFYNQVMAAFGLVNCGTAACITEDNVEANFGWDDEQEDCFSWSEKGAAVVDTDCVVAIPKTGDASVLAWLF